MSFFPNTNLGGTGTPLGMNGTPTGLDGNGFSPAFGTGMHGAFPLALQSPAVRDVQMGNSGEVTRPMPAGPRIKRQSETRSCCLSEHLHLSFPPPHFFPSPRLVALSIRCRVLPVSGKLSVHQRIRAGCSKTQGVAGDGRVFSRIGRGSCWRKESSGP